MNADEYCDRLTVNEGKCGGRVAFCSRLGTSEGVVMSMGVVFVSFIAS